MRAPVLAPKPPRGRWHGITRRRAPLAGPGRGEGTERRTADVERNPGCGVRGRSQAAFRHVTGKMVPHRIDRQEPDGLPRNQLPHSLIFGKHENFQLVQHDAIDDEKTGQMRADDFA